MMAVYHLACRIALDGKQSPPARLAKWIGNCAGCTTTVQKGDMISCTRDNANGKRRQGSGLQTGEGPTVFAQGSNEDPPDGSFTCNRCEAVDTASHGGSILVDRVTGRCVDETMCYSRANPHPSPPSAVSPPSVPGESGILEALTKALQGRITAGVDRDSVIDIARREVQIVIGEASAEIEARVRASIAPVTRVEILAPNGTVTPVEGIQHRQFPTLMRAIASGCNVWIAGPAGTGKTTAAHEAAKALGLAYSYTGTTHDPIHLSGYRNVHGEYVSTLLRERYEHGGLHLLDEVDGWDPSATLWLNAMLANGTAAFPDRMVDRHASCSLVATANTWGNGGTAEYVGRTRQDAAFLDRWVMLEWETDEDLERATCSNAAWVRRVQFIRERVKLRGIKAMVTPRASYAGAKLLAQGIDQEIVERMVLKRGMTSDQWRQVDS